MRPVSTFFDIQLSNSSISAPKDRMSDDRILQLKEMILKTKKQIENEVGNY